MISDPSQLLLFLPGFVVGWLARKWYGRYASVYYSTRRLFRK